MFYIQVEEELKLMFSLLWTVLYGSIGCVTMVIIVSKYYYYLQILHENHLWFSNIKVGAVISF